MDLTPELQSLARSQHGLLTRKQLAAGGMTPRQVREGIAGQWRPILPGVILLARTLPATHQRLVAALLHAGPRSRLAGPTAAALHSLPNVTAIDEQPVVHVVVPAPQVSRSVGWLRIQRTYLTGERPVERGALRLCTKARALVDAAALADGPTARSMLIDSIQQRLVRGEDVAHWIEARERRGRGRLTSALAEAMAGAWSLPEADLRALLESSPRLPVAWPNPELRDADGTLLTTPDLWLDDVALAVMVHSRRYHSRGLDWDRTVEQDSDLSAARIVVVGVTPSAIARSPQHVLARVESAYAKARATGHRPSVTATPRYPVLRSAPRSG